MQRSPVKRGARTALAIAALVAAALALIALVATAAPLHAQRTQKPPLHAKHWIAITGKPLGATAGYGIAW